MLRTYVIALIIANTSLTQSIDVHNRASLNDLSQKTGISVQELKSLNPSYGQPSQRIKKIRIPNKHVHIVEEGDTLNRILARYHLTTHTFYQYNPTFKTLVPKQRLAISPKGAALLFQPRQIPTPTIASPSRTFQPKHHTSYQDRSFSNLNILHKTTPYFQGNKTSSKTQPPIKDRLTLNFLNHKSDSSQNLYLQGQCTYYAFQRRMELGRPIHNHWGDAKHWYAHARAQGYHVSTSPQLGAIMVSQEGPFGHVAIVEAIKSNAIVVSEMNWVGPFVVNHRVIESYEQFYFIH
ncbi:COG3942 and LysM peptidoglycan-binding domain-containing protein [Staphylococcus agnetis]|uniref:COG3942 and LysM peptidoglycan-binding domain-containing protein n=1 Tax=Staphylococcus agnetis TaxID=985762 RepID=UPI001430C0A1|nr:CHAP domain-containing protein [Staphylococcus agnetis]NJH97132.1 CHAP domain-containing protein [Staphylococcus agnetis]